MINKNHFLDNVIKPVLIGLDMDSKAAQVLLLGTGLAESNLSALVQYGGPALSMYQIEPATHLDIWRNYLDYRVSVAKKVVSFMSQGLTGLEQLPGNLYYATAITRIHYIRVPDRLPSANDPEGMSNYHKDHYNTSAGKANATHNTRYFEEAIATVL